MSFSPSFTLVSPLTPHSHPDKVKATAEMTIEAIQDKFVGITKAYKSLTDETIRKNWLEWNNPDGPQTTSHGIALPKWIVESKNNIWVLGAYGVLFGGALPLLVGRWWFGNRSKTKDGIHARSAAAFFKSLADDSRPEEVVGALGKAFEYELDAKALSTAAADAQEITKLDNDLSARVGKQWGEVKKLAKGVDGELHETRKRALVLLYAHLVRLEVKSSQLQKGAFFAFTPDEILTDLEQSNDKSSSKPRSSSTLSSTSQLHETGFFLHSPSCASTPTSPKLSL